MVNEGSGSVKSLFKIFDFVIDYYAISLSNKEALYYMHENTVFFFLLPLVFLHKGLF